MCIRDSVMEIFLFSLFDDDLGLYCRRDIVKIVTGSLWFWPFDFDGVPLYHLPGPGLCEVAFAICDY